MILLQWNSVHVHQTCGSCVRICVNCLVVWKMIFVGDCRLFTVDADVEAGLCVSYTFKLSPTCSSVQLAVGLTFSRPPTKRPPTDGPPTERPPSQLWLTGARADCSQLTGSSGRCLSFTEEQVVSSWTTRSQLCLAVIVSLWWYTDGRGQWSCVV